MTSPQRPLLKSPLPFSSSARLFFGKVGPGLRCQQIVRSKRIGGYLPAGPWIITSLFAWQKNAACRRRASVLPGSHAHAVQCGLGADQSTSSASTYSPMLQ